MGRKEFKYGVMESRFSRDDFRLILVSKNRCNRDWGKMRIHVFAVLPIKVELFFGHGKMNIGVVFVLAWGYGRRREWIIRMDDMGQKMLPIGIENFEEIRTEEFYYVDKTGMIKELLYRRGKVNLFTRPRRLKSVNGADYQTARSLMGAVIGNEAMRFYRLLSSDKLTREEKEIYKQLITVDKTGQGVFSMSDAVLMGSLKTLSSLLEKHYGKKVIVLVDEYDVPLAKANEQGYYDQMIFLIRGMFEQVLKTNDSLYFAVLTGCLRVSKESVFTGLNNLKVFSITDSECDSWFGFTDDEVRKMLGEYGLEEKYEIIKEWYNGYRFGNSDVYCPWDVINYVSKLQIKRTVPPQDFWMNTSGNEVIKKLLEQASSSTRNEIERLIAGESIGKAVNEELTYKELYDHIENIWSILFAAGYLTQRGEAEGRMYRLAIPNREIHTIFMTQIRAWMQDKAREDVGRLNAFCQAFKDADKENAEKIFTEYLDETISVRDTAVRKELKENFYRGFLLGLLRFKEDWKVTSNRESGKGYADIVVEVFSEKTGIVIEMKYAEDGNLEGSCKEAMKQIEEGGYVNQLDLDGMDNIIRCGIACHVKSCKILFA